MSVYDRARARAHAARTPTLGTHRTSIVMLETTRRYAVDASMASVETFSFAQAIEQVIGLVATRVAIGQPTPAQLFGCQYAALAQRAMAAGELEAADKVIAEGMAVVGSAGEEAEFLSGALLMVSASVHRCSNRHADALQAFDRMAELLPVDLDANPERQEGVRSLFRLDLIKLLLASTMIFQKSLELDLVLLY